RDPDPARIAELLGPADGVQVLAPDGTAIVRLVPDGLDSTRVATRATAEGARVVVVTDADPLDERFRDQLAILMLLAVGAILGAGALAAIQGHQLARPLERLAARAARIGDG